VKRAARARRIEPGHGRGLILQSYVDDTLGEPILRLICRRAVTAAPTRDAGRNSRETRGDP
jgi:hypothetical protein